MRYKFKIKHEKRSLKIKNKILILRMLKFNVMLPIIFNYINL